MDVTESVLEDLRDLCTEYYRDEAANIRAVVLYGGAAKNFVGQDHAPGDFDLNIFFSDRSSVSSTYGMPKIIGEYGGLKVEVMRNKVPEEMSIERYVETRGSKRWKRIREEPAVQVYPEITRLSW
ncbi:hypothetical protein [Halobellus rufus]|uniref:hypothetical protein n=1 Tax=Halobellus rufus TaxID=1448860 RepID=UPI0006796139|nr:hypothetical protein [Halobellus rufus]